MNNDEHNPTQHGHFRTDLNCVSSVKKSLSILSVICFSNAASNLAALATCCCCCRSKPAPPPPGRPAPAPAVDMD